MNIFLILLGGVFLNAAAQLLLKAGMQRIGHFEFALANLLPIGLQVASNPFIILGLGCYVISVLLWLLVLSRVEVSVAYPMVSIGYIIAAVAGWYFFSEQLTPMRVAGIVIIMIGVFMVSRTA